MIKLIKPYISFDEVEKDFKDVFDSGWFTKGKNVDLFREKICKYTGANYSFLATSATTALSMVLNILKIKPGDEVIVSDFSFPATANVVEEIGATPVFCDVEIDTFNMDAEVLKSKITAKTKAVIFVDALGNPTGVSEILDICRENNIPLIEDAACAIGSSENSIKCGNISDFSCFSFHPRKLLTTGEGGAITVNTEKYNEILDIRMNHGSVVNDGKFDFIDYGYNYRMSELQAVMGIKQLQKLDDIVTSRNIIRNRYIDLLDGTGLTPQKVGENVVYNVQSLIFVTPENVSRDGLISHLKENGIESCLGTYCLSGTTFYRNKYDDVQDNALYLEKNTITLPCYDGVDVDYICKIIKDYV